MSRSQIVALLKEQLDTIKQKKSIKLNSLPSTTKPSELIDTIYEFLTSFDPSLELEKLAIQNSQLIELPSNFHKIASSIKYLDLHQNSISYIPQDFFYGFDSLEILDLASNDLEFLPDSLSSVTTLKVISIKDNSFKYISPQLGELPNLNLIEVSGNPSLLPSNDIIRAFQQQKPDLDWVGELKNYLVANRMLINLKIQEAMEKSSQKRQQVPKDSTPETSQTTSDPVIARSKSGSISTSFSSKASRRMGLIIKKSDENSDGSSKEDANNSLISGAVPDHVTTEGIPHVDSPTDISFQLPKSPPTSTPGTTTPSTQTAPATTSTNKNLGVTLTSSARGRSNTFKEIDRMLEKSESVDTERKSNAYFKRLSTLQELPGDELSEYSQPKKPAAEGKQASGNVSKSNNTAASENSPAKPQQQSKLHINPVIIRVSRKILFSFSELHSSIRRFTSFCSDKKVTMKMVSYLYSTKSNIDSLVENLEIMEESGDNSEQIVQALHNCIGSFKSIMKLLHENIQSFVGNIEVCFIRMVYLSVFGSLNELQNAYLLLCPKASAKSPSTEMKQKLSINTTTDADEKLYSTIELATSSTQTIFSELNKTINKGATTSANGGVVHPTVASKIKELAKVCAASLDIIKRLNTKLITIRNNPSVTTKKLFAEDINQFIKTVVQTLAAVKAIVKDIPILDDIRASMSNLTKTAKEVTYFLEVSSYKSLLPDSSSTGVSQQPQLISVPSVSNLFTPVAAHAPSLPTSGGQAASNGPTPIRNPSTNSSITTTTLVLPPLNLQESAPLTAPVQSSGQMFAKHGLNPFDGLIMARNNDNQG